MPVNDLILIRAGTSAQWSAANPILSGAEPGFDTTLQRIKYGNGSTPWNTLPWSGPIGISGLSITPESGFFTNIFSGVFANALLHAYSSTSGATVFNAEGTNGSLFSVIDSLSGSLMIVNNNAGLPVFEVFSDDRVIAGRFNQNDFIITSGGNIGIGTPSPISKLQVSGLITANSGNFIQNLLVNNTGVSLSGHTHLANDITNFSSSVSGLLPFTGVLGSGNIFISSSNKILNISTTGLQPSGDYSLVGHTHISSDITDFNSVVSGLLPVKNIIASGQVSVSSSNGIFTVGVTGLQSSGNYSISGHQHTISDIINFNSGVSGLLNPYALLSSGNFTNLYVTNTPVSLSGHTHTTSNITDFDSSVSGLLPVKNIIASGYTLISSNNGVFTVGVTGLQPSGNYSISGHQHTTFDITDFNSGVSGLLPVISITGGYGIGVTNVSGNHTVYSTLNTVNESYTLIATVFNKNGSALPKFSVVYISGAQGDLPAVTLALANGEPKSSKTFGITEEQIPSMSSGRVVVYGNIYGLDTDQFNPNAPYGDINGQVLYLSPTVSGGLTLTKPYAPDHMVSVGTVIRTHQNQGIFNVRIQNGFELQELHNVATTGAVSGQFLKYDGSIWRNSGIISSDISDFSSAVSGISPNINISGTSGISVDKNGNNYTVYTTGTFGLSSSQVQSLLNSGVSIYVTSGTGNFSSLSVNGTGVSLSGHTHSLSGVSSGLVYQNNGSIFIGTDDQTVNLEIKGSLSFRDLSVFMGEVLAGKITASELYAVGDVDILPVSLSGHQHTSSDITNFNSSVSGLLPITSIVGTSGASASLSGTTVTVAVTGSFGLTSSGIQDLLNSGVSINVISGSGNFNSLSVNNTGVSISGHSHILTIGSGSGTAITYDSSQTLNILGSGNSIVSYDNSNKTIYINSPWGIRGYEILGSGKNVFTVDGGYIVGNIDVFYNGVKLLNGNDFTATNGTTFSLANSGIVGDVVEWSAFSTSPRYQIIMGEVRSDFVSGVNYIGNAIQGSSESSEVWRIKKTTIDSDGSIVSNLTANNVRWTDRLTASYV